MRRKLAATPRKLNKYLKKKEKDVQKCGTHHSDLGPTFSSLVFAVVHQGDFFGGGSPQRVLQQTDDKSPWTCLTLLCCCFSVTDPLRLPGLVFSVLCIHQLRSFPGQKNQRVPFWTGSVTREHREGPETEDEDKEDSERLSAETFGTGTLNSLGAFSH